MSLLSYGAGQIHTTPLYHYIYVVAGTTEETVADISSDDKSPDAQFSGSLGHNPEYRFVQISFSNSHTNAKIAKITYLCDMSSQEKIWDPLRRKMVALTPEERVRQWFIQILHCEAQVPLHLMNSEVEMNYGTSGKTYRADILIYGRNVHPVGIVECKRPDIPLTSEVLDQALRYHMVLDAKLLFITNGNETRIFERTPDGWRAASTLPTYQEMISI